MSPAYATDRMSDCLRSFRVAQAKAPIGTIARRAAQKKSTGSKIEPNCKPPAIPGQSYASIAATIVVATARLPPSQTLKKAAYGSVVILQSGPKALVAIPAGFEPATLRVEI